MQKVFTYLLAICFSGTAAMAQNGSPYWSTTGNNNATGTSKLGTTNSISLHFFTNNVQRMYIDSANGRIGIGVTAPQDRLHVNSAGGENAFRAQVSGVTKLLVFANGGTALGSNVTPPANGLYVFGNTGLGNTSPVYKLEVKGDIDIDSGLFRVAGDPVLKYNSPNQSISLGNSGGTGTRLNTAVGYYALINSTSGQANVALGHKTLYSNTAGYSNVAVGSHALFSNTTGNQNIAIGDSALYNSTGTFYSNTALGSKALYSGTSAYDNTALGFQALYSTTTGGDNTAIGHALYNNTAGSINVGIGYNALSSNATGNSNVGLGNAALIYNTTGGYNTGVGTFTLSGNSTGSFNTAVGYSANISTDGLTNATAIGYSATATASNQVMLGNSSVTAVEAYGPYYNLSDGRVKKNIKENVPGLAFINSLRPVTYNYDVHGINNKTGITATQNKNATTDNNAYANKTSVLAKASTSDNALASADKINDDAINAKEKISYTGFVAQEVEAAAKKLNYDFSGVHQPQNEKDLYALSYSDFVVPLVKAVQELSKQNDSLKNELASIHNDIAQLKSLLPNGAHTLVNTDVSSQTVTLSSAALLQNVPNPFANSTTINYTLPGSYAKASVVITDKSGRIIKTVLVNGSHAGSISVDASTLSAGAYQYSLFVDGRLTDTKQMILSR